MSTPQVAAFAARLRQYFTEGYYYLAGSNPASRGFIPSGALLKAMLIHSGQAMSYSTSHLLIDMERMHIT